MQEVERVQAQLKQAQSSTQAKLIEVGVVYTSYRVSVHLFPLPVEVDVSGV